MLPAPASERAAPLRVATYNIHKGVQGFGPARRLEIHNLAQAVEMLDADIVCLQEVRAANRREARHFAAWPDQPQAEFLAPPGYQAVYCTNAVTPSGEHGNALLTRWPVLDWRHEDLSDHRFEQRGLLHVQLRAYARLLHVIVVHFGLIPASRARQADRLKRYIARAVPGAAPLIVAGDFNDWGTRVRRILGLGTLEALEGPHTYTYPARLPIVQLDHIYVRGLTPTALTVPRGRAWYRMSDHLPLIADFKMAA
ncbi:MAG: endonuclease/exonuclease/phosphatase family protein [Burkholderiaceae bacterium]|jgi:endonuclease/exonuclease/phosphatase family metal-dependent hydrolase|nr:endonuclease/exonuclease/phosphatase family protein [Burkholderiaceae bacterium]